MENTTNYIDETDYKLAWKYENDRNRELTDKLKAKTEEMEHLAFVVDDLTSRLEGKEEQLGYADRRICRQEGMIDAFKYCVRYYMAGGAE